MQNKLDFASYCSHNYTLPQKKRRFLKVAFLLVKSVYQWTWHYVSFTSTGKMGGLNLRFFWGRVYLYIVGCHKFVGHSSVGLAGGFRWRPHFPGMWQYFQEKLPFQAPILSWVLSEHSKILSIFLVPQSCWWCWIVLRSEV